MTGRDETTTNIIDDDDQVLENIKKDAYFLTSSDSLHLILTQVQLKEDNYNELVKAMRLALRAKKKLGFVEGIIPKSKA